MSAKLAPGDKVTCRLYNTPDRRFYGQMFTAVILEVVPVRDYKNHTWNLPPAFRQEKYGYIVSRLIDNYTLTLHRREIIRRN